MSEAQIPMWQRWAQFRFSVIGELLSSPPHKGQLQKSLQRLSEGTYQHPIDENRQIDYREMVLPGQRGSRSHQRTGSKDPV